MPLSQEHSPVERVVEIKHADGLHMRPAMEFVECASSFSSRISIYKGSQSVDGKSIMQITTLAATKGTQLRIRAVGKDAQDAVDTLAGLLERSAEGKQNQA